MEFVLGALGSLMVIAAFIGGVFVGQKITVKPITKEETDKEQAEQERREIIQSQEAFRQLMNFSREEAYGMNGGLNE